MILHSKDLDDHPVDQPLSKAQNPDTATKAPPMRPCRVKDVCSKNMSQQNLHKKKQGVKDMTPLFHSFLC